MSGRIHYSAKYQSRIFLSAIFLNLQENSASEVCMDKHRHHQQSTQLISRTSVKRHSFPLLCSLCPNQVINIAPTTAHSVNALCIRCFAHVGVCINTWFFFFPSLSPTLPSSQHYVPSIFWNLGILGQIGNPVGKKHQTIKF